MSWGLNVYKPLIIPVQRCTTGGIYLRWWFNGWHYYCFTNQHEVTMRTAAADIMVQQVFSVISKIEKPTKITTDYAYRIVVTGITAGNVDGFAGLLLAERVEQYEGGSWYEVDITRGAHGVQEAGEPAYELEFEITRKELPNTAAVYQKSQYLYIGSTLADMDDDEIIPQNKQVNDIAEMQDRQSDFTATFKVRKSRAMRALFELSGEVGASTDYPYREQTCKLVQDGIEIITGGKVVLNKVDDKYYHISIYSGNLNFFTAIENLKLTDLTLASTNHTWEASVQAASNVSDLDYVYPLCEPSDDGGITPMTDTGSRVEVYGGWLWPFIKVKAIWDEIFTAAGFTVEGDILTDPHFLRLFMPIVNLNISKQAVAPWLYNGFWQGWRNYTAPTTTLIPSYVLVGDANYGLTGKYITPYAATYKLRAVIWVITSYPSHVYIYADGVQVVDMTAGETGLDAWGAWHLYDGEYAALKGVELTIRVTPCLNVTQYTTGVLTITDIRIDYASVLTPALNLPDMTQTDFIKTVCNLYGLIPETDSRRRVIRFWNYSKLYQNIPQARDWSAYLSERDDEVEFKFGDYAQQNYLRYKDCDDVLLDAGVGVMVIDDETLPLKKDVVQLPLATTDEVLILTDVPVSQIDFNKYDEKTDTYKQNKSIDPRLVYVSAMPNTKTFGIRDEVAGGTSYDSVGAKKASAAEASFSNMISYYNALAKMLTKTNLRRAQFNLPAYEVAGFKHYIPIYLSQYKAYFYVNKISNYVVGRLCTIELIKL
jgi:hypothetical protein